MNIVFRADAATRIGSGHVMRCLTLAGVLRERGVAASFVCRQHEGHLCELIQSRGFEVMRLPAGESVDWRDDAQATIDALHEKGLRPDWLIVDHYGLGHEWESALRPVTGRIMAIDDLADRRHDVDLLLDQNVDNPLHRKYAQLLPASATLLLGTQYALIRPEFAAQREQSLARRNGQLERLLVFMGGSDPKNDTGRVLAGLKMVSAAALQIDVVIGSSNPHRPAIAEACALFPRACLHVQTERMAELMMLADCTIGAGGSATWERCTLGLPALVTIQADNQEVIANVVHRAGGHRLLGRSHVLLAEDYGRAVVALTHEDLRRMSATSATLCDGLGASRVADHLLSHQRPTGTSHE